MEGGAPFCPNSEFCVAQSGPNIGECRETLCSMRTEASAYPPYLVAPQPVVNGAE
ncbi:hypothetical protein LEMLEM_LOCUS11037 [Lemmus lemmus]